MATVVLALVAAVAYGLSDFVGGVAARRTSAWPIALLAAFGGLVGAILLAVAYDGSPGAADQLWGALAGVGSGAGTVFLYRGFASGRMGVVAPVSGVGAALLPVAAGLALGERPAALVWLGIVLALPAIWLVARLPDEAGTVDPGGVLDGLLAGVGFGGLFVAMGQVPEGAGYWPLAVAQGVALVLVAAAAIVLGQPWLPTERTHWWGAVAGLLASGAVLAFLLATQTGLLTIAAVLTSLYPAVTVLLAAVALREPILRLQAVGLVLSGAAVALIAGG